MNSLFDSVHTVTTITVCTGTWLPSSRTQKPWFESRYETRYINLPNLSELQWGPHSFLCNRHWDRGGGVNSFPWGRKRPVCEAGHPPQFWTENENAWSRNFTPPICLRAVHMLTSTSQTNLSTEWYLRNNLYNKASGLEYTFISCTVGCGKDLSLTVFGERLLLRYLHEIIGSTLQKRNKIYHSSANQYSLVRHKYSSCIAF